MRYNPRGRDIRVATAHEEDRVARRRERQSSGRRAPSRNRRPRPPRPRADQDIIAQSAMAVREVETAVQRGQVKPSTRTKFQVVGLLVREQRAIIKAADGVNKAQRDTQLKRLDGIATILATT